MLLAFSSSHRHAHAPGSWRPSKGEARPGKAQGPAVCCREWPTTPAPEAPEWLAAFGFGLWVGVGAGLRVVKAVAEVEHGSFGVDLGEVVEVVVGWG